MSACPGELEGRMLFNKFCRNKNCENYIEWEYSFDSQSQLYPCISCTLIGQSYDITEYPPNCKFLPEIKKYEKQNSKVER